MHAAVGADRGHHAAGRHSPAVRASPHPWPSKTPAHRRGYVGKGVTGAGRAWGHGRERGAAGGRGRAPGCARAVHAYSRRGMGPVLYIGKAKQNSEAPSNGSAAARPKQSLLPCIDCRHTDAVHAAVGADRGHHAAGRHSPAVRASPHPWPSKTPAHRRGYVGKGVTGAGRAWGHGRERGAAGGRGGPKGQRRNLCLGH